MEERAVRQVAAKAQEGTSARHTEHRDKVTEDRICLHMVTDVLQPCGVYSGDSKHSLVPGVFCLYKLALIHTTHQDMQS